MKTSTKKVLANRMLSTQERKSRIPVFYSKAWLDRKEAIATRVAKKQESAHARALIRKAEKNPKTVTKKELKKAQTLIKKIETRRLKNLKHNAKKK